MQVRSLGREDPLEEGMAIHSSILAWRIPRIEELGGLQSIGHTELDMTEATSHVCMILCRGLPWWLSDKESACSAGDVASIPGWGKSPGAGNGSH